MYQSVCKLLPNSWLRGLSPEKEVARGSSGVRFKEGPVPGSSGGQVSGSRKAPEVPPAHPLRSTHGCLCAEQSSTKRRLDEDWHPRRPLSAPQNTVKAVLGILNTDLAGGLGDLSIALVLPLLSLVLPALPFGLPLLGLVLPALPFGLPLLGLVLPALPFGLPP